MSRSTIAVLACAAVALAAAGAPGALADEVKPKTLAEYLEARQPDFARFGVRPYGWVAASATTTLTPHGDRREARVFDDYAEGVHLNQAYLALERTPDEERAFDLGGKVAGIFGTDARFLHAAGWMDDQDGDEQADLLEANLVARAAVGCGLTLKVGRFTTPLGYEVIEEPNVPLPSRGLLFGYAIPFTHVGGLLAWQVDKTVKLSYGLVRGWDVGDDNNDAWSHLFGLGWTSPQGGDTVTLQAIVGAERPDDDRHLRTVVDAVWAIDLSPTWKAAFAADVGYEQDAVPDGDAMWWGGALYLAWAPTGRATWTLRLEGFRDRDGTRLGTPATLSDVTFGLDWRPIPSFANLRLRPEVRWDHAWDGAFFDGGRERDQVSATLGAIVTF
ncbi:MAG: outer membrane beta-barrel protein [Planctomycetota bacterium]